MMIKCDSCNELQVMSGECLNSTSGSKATADPSDCMCASHSIHYNNNNEIPFMDCVDASALESCSTIHMARCGLLDYSD